MRVGGIARNGFRRVNKGHGNIYNWWYSMEGRKKEKRRKMNEMVVDDGCESRGEPNQLDNRPSKQSMGVRKI
jgi:hypothetical protein